MKAYTPEEQEAYWKRRRQAMDAARGGVTQRCSLCEPSGYWADAGKNAAPDCPNCKGTGVEFRPRGEMISDA